MKFSVNKDAFQKGVAQAERIAGKHLSLPVLHCVLILAQGKEVVLRATNLDLGLEVRIPAQIEEDGVVAVPASTLGSFLGATPNADTLTLRNEDKHVVITTPKTEIKVPVYNHEDFPLLPPAPTEELFSVNAADFAGALRSVWWAASTTSIKPELSSVYIFANGSELTCVATDSFRLAEKRISGKAPQSFEGVLIPLKNVAEVIRHIENAERGIVVRGDGHQIGIDVDGAYLSSRIIDGNFPDYQQIVPKEFGSQATLLKQDMLDALKQSRIFSDQFNKVSAKFDSDEKSVTLKTINPTTGESVITLEGDVTGESLELNFNYAYWSDPLQSIKTDRIAIEFAGAGKPARIRSVGDQSFTYIVMPMNR